MTIRLEGISVIVINIYNPIGNKKVIIIEISIGLALNKIKKYFLLKNFNTYHPAWGGRAAAIKTKSEDLLKEMK